MSSEVGNASFFIGNPYFTYRVLDGSPSYFNISLTDAPYEVVGLAVRVTVNNDYKRFHWTLSDQTPDITGSIRVNGNLNPGNTNDWSASYCLTGDRYSALSICSAIGWGTDNDVRHIPNAITAVDAGSYPFIGFAFYADEANADVGDVEFEYYWIYRNDGSVAPTAPVSTAGWYYFTSPWYYNDRSLNAGYNDWTWSHAGPAQYNIVGFLLEYQIKNNWTYLFAPTMDDFRNYAWSEEPFLGYANWYSQGLNNYSDRVCYVKGISASASTICNAVGWGSEGYVVTDWDYVLSPIYPGVHPIVPFRLDSQYRSAFAHFRYKWVYHGYPGYPENPTGPTLPNIFLSAPQSTVFSFDFSPATSGTWGNNLVNLDPPYRVIGVVYDYTVNQTFSNFVTDWSWMPVGFSVGWTDYDSHGGASSLRRCVVDPKYDEQSICTSFGYNSNETRSHFSDHWPGHSLALPFRYDGESGTVTINNYQWIYYTENAYELTATPTPTNAPLPTGTNIPPPAPTATPDGIATVTPAATITPYVPPDIIVTIEFPDPTITPVPTDIPFDPVGDFGGPISLSEWSAPGVAEVIYEEYSNLCLPTINSQLTGSLTICVQYIYFKSLMVLGIVVPMWPFVGFLFLTLIAFVIKR